MNINGTPGRGSVGTDLNAIPSFAIERVEVLRRCICTIWLRCNCRSYQCGDEENTNQLTAAITAGAFNSKGSNDHQKGWDGDKYQLDLNYGTKIGSNGFINFTGSLMSRGDTRRANAATGTIFNAYNAIEQRALQNGVNINSLFQISAIHQIPSVLLITYTSMQEM